MSDLLARANKYAGACFNCSAKVRPNRGYLISREQLEALGYTDLKKAWPILCNSRPCVESVAGKAAVDEADRRCIDAEGRIFLNEDDEARPFLLAMGSRDPQTKRWTASPHRRDRDHVLRVAAKLGLEVDPAFAEYEDPESVRAAVARARAIPTIREYQVGGVRWFAYRGLDDVHPSGFNMKDNKRGFLEADDQGLGKQQPVDTKVCTPQGWREMGELRVGDFVSGSDGKPTRVSGVFPQGVKPSYRVHFNDGSSVEAGPAHLWTMHAYKGRKLEALTVTTEQLRTGATLTREWPNHQPTTLTLSKRKLYLPMLSGPLELPTASLPIPPYTLGALIANGCLGHGTSSLTVGACDWPEVLQQLRAEGADIRKVRQYKPTVIATVVCGIYPAVRSLGLNVRSRLKFIPEVYKLADVSQRLAMLHGLMDGDGTCSMTRNRVTYCTTSARLADDVRELAESLGCIASVRSYDRSHDNKPTDYNVRLRLPLGVLPFLLRRKAARYQPGVRTSPTRAFVRADYVRDVESVCISVEAEDNLYVTEHCILTHNTIQTLLALRDDESLAVVCNSSAKEVWPREAQKWRADRFDKFTILQGEESFRWPENTRELVVLNYDILPSTHAQIEDEIEHGLAKLDGHLGDADSKVKWKRKNVRSLRKQLARAMRPAVRLEKSGALTTTAGRHAYFLALVEVVETDLPAKIKRVEQALARARLRKPVEKGPSCPVLLVGDELHYVESSKALRTQRWRHLTRFARRVGGLTGTPFESDPLRGQGLLRSACAQAFAWVDFLRAFNGHKGHYAIEFARHPPPPGSSAMGSIIIEPGTTEQLQRVLMRRTKEEVLPELPPKVFTEIPVPLTDKIRKQLDEITAVYAPELLAGELPPFEAMSSLLKALSKHCIPTLLDVVGKHEAEGRPVVVFAANHSPIEALMKRKGWMGAYDSRCYGGKNIGEIQDRFQAGEGVGVAGTAAIAESITLTRASNVVQAIPFMSRKKNSQAYDRCHRIGQLDTVNVEMLVPDHVFIHHILALLVAKDQFVSDVLEGESTPSLENVARFIDEPVDQWRARAERQTQARKEQAERSRRREQLKRERELAEIAGREVSPKTSEQRAKLRAERLTADRKQAGNGELVVDFDADKKTVQAALSYMLARCDGAREKDDAGFNAPDSAVARWLAPGVRKGSKFALASMASILKRYPRQLSGDFPGLFG